MTEPVELLRRDTALNGWGHPARKPALPGEVRAMLSERIGACEPSPPVPIGDIELSEVGEIPASVIAAAGGPGAVSDDLEDRLRHAAGKSYPDLIRMRTGAVAGAPDAIVAPPDGAAVAAVLTACSREGVAVVPFGGGTSVVGGVDACRGTHANLIALDLTALRDVEVDRISHTAHLGPGLRGPEAEAALASRGFSLGHFPQSFCFATVGGFAATRSAGQASSGYGRFDALVTELELAAPVGTLRTRATPHTAAGPSLRELVLGSEGVFGAITDVAVRVRPAPAARRYEAWFAPGFAEGIEIARTLAQDDVLPDVFRLSDRDETATSLALAGLEGFRRTAFERYLKLRRREQGCMLIAGWEGEREAVDRRRQLAVRLLREGGAVSLGTSGGRSWERGRYEGPYLRDSLLDAGVLVDTLETSHLYSRIGELYDAVRSALLAEMETGERRGIVMCHVSHVYRDGASLYFTFLTPASSGEEIQQWRGLKAAACEAIVAAGGTITHHHAVGRDHAPYMEAEIGQVGLAALRAVKDELDPAGIMNPAKLLTG